MTRTTKAPVQQVITKPEPWHSWGTTVRYLVIRLGLAVPGIALVWLLATLH